MAKLSTYFTYTHKCAHLHHIADEIRTGVYRNLFAAEQLITGEEDSAANYARGYFTKARQLMTPIDETLRQLAENCDQLLAFHVYRSNGGGTGSGLTSGTCIDAKLPLCPLPS